MTIAQIGAVIALLIAFGVDGPTVSNVQGILEASVATSSISQPAATTTQKVEQPVGSQVTSNPQPTVQEDLSGVTAFIYNHTEEASYPHGVFAVQVSLLDSNGKYVKDATFQLSVSDNLIENETERNVDGRTTVKANDWNTRFRYAPSSPGSKTLTFTSGDFTKTLTIEVQ